MNLLSSIPIYFILLELWSHGILPLLLWWTIGATMLIFCAEGLFRCIPSHHVASRAMVWRTTIVFILLLPLSLAWSPFRLNLDFPISSISQNQSVPTIADTKELQSSNEQKFNQRNSQIPIDTSNEKIASNPIQNDNPDRISDPDQQPALSTTRDKTENRRPSDRDPLIIITFWVYSFVIFLLFCRNQIRVWKIALFVRSAMPCTNPSLLALVESCKQSLKIKKKIDIRTHPENFSPAIVCFRKPVLLFPDRMMESWNESELRPIVLHELCHLARKDYRYEKMCHWISTILWFFPIWMLLRKRLEETRELYCDVVAANDCIDRSFYLHQLVRIMDSVIPPFSKPAPVYSFRKGQKTLDRLSLLMQDELPFQTRMRRWQKSFFVSTGCMAILVMGGVRVSFPFSIPIAATSLQNNPQAQELIQEYEKRSIAAHEGGYIVARARHQNFFTEQEIADKAPNTHLIFDRIVDVTEYIQAPSYRREMSEYRSYNENQTTLELVEKGTTEELIWENTVEIYNTTEYARYHQNRPDRELELTMVKPREEEIASSMDASPERKQEILKSHKLILHNITPLRYLYSFHGADLSDIVDHLQTGEWIATQTIDEGTHIVSLYDQRGILPLMTWWIPESTYPYPTRIESMNGPLVGEVKEFTYTPDRKPKTYSSISYMPKIENGQLRELRATHRYDLWIETYETGVSHDPKLFVVVDKQLEKKLKEESKEYTPEERKSLLEKGNESSLELIMAPGVDLSETQQAWLKGYILKERTIDYEYPSLPDIKDNGNSLSLFRERPYKIELAMQDNQLVGIYYGHIYQQNIRYDKQKKMSREPESSVQFLTVPFVIPNPNTPPILNWNRSTTDNGPQRKSISNEEFNTVIPAYDPVGFTLKGIFVVKKEEGVYTWTIGITPKENREGYKSSVVFYNFSQRDVPFKLIESSSELTVQLPPKGIIPAQSFDEIQFSLPKEAPPDSYKALFRVDDPFVKTFIATIEIDDN